MDFPGLSGPAFSRIGIVGPPIVKSRFDHQIKLYPDSYETGRTDYLYADLFVSQVAANIKPVNDRIVRKFTSLDLVFFAADQNFRDYIETYKNAGDLDMPPRGNITIGLGLFTMVRTADSGQERRMKVGIRMKNSEFRGIRFKASQACLMTPDLNSCLSLDI